MKFNLCICIILFFISCNEADTKAGSSNPETALKVPAVSETRANPKKEPVATYSERTDNPLNTWYFKVQLYETPATFRYLVKLQFEEIRGEDTLRLPNLGQPPQPELRKGPDKYSCIIGFKDQQGNFREYKKAYVRNNSLKITALKHYGVRK